MAYLDQVSYGGTLYDVNDTKGRAMIAPKEESSTASSAHAAGTYFTYNDLLYRATADIAVGGTITPNTNCVAVTVGGETSELKSATTDLDALQTLDTYIPDCNVVIGGITGGIGQPDQDIVSPIRARTRYIATSGGVVTVTGPSGYNWALSGYDENLLMVYSSGYKATPITIDSHSEGCAYVRMLFKVGSAGTDNPNLDDFDDVNIITINSRLANIESDAASAVSDVDQKLEYTAVDVTQQNVVDKYIPDAQIVLGGLNSHSDETPPKPDTEFASTVRARTRYIATNGGAVTIRVPSGYYYYVIGYGQDKIRKMVTDFLSVASYIDCAKEGITFLRIVYKKGSAGTDPIVLSDFNSTNVMMFSGILTNDSNSLIDLFGVAGNDVYIPGVDVEIGGINGNNSGTPEIESITPLRARTRYVATYGGTITVNAPDGYQVAVTGYNSDKVKVFLNAYAVPGYTIDTYNKNIAYVRMQYRVGSAGTANVDLDDFTGVDLLEIRKRKIKSDEIEDVIKQDNVLYYQDSVTVTGSATYVYKNIFEYTGGIHVGDIFAIKAESITGATIDDQHAYVTYLYNGDTLIREWTDTLTIRDSDIANGANKILFRLYPAKGTALPSGSATYTNLYILKGYETGYEITGTLKNAVVNTIDDNKYTVPAYYMANDYLANKARRINELGSTCDDVFGFITDIHWYFNTQNSPLLLYYLSEKCQIPRVFVGGDVADGAIQGIDFWHKIKNCYGKTHNVVGNHDIMHNTTMKQLYYWFDSNKDDQIGNAFEHYWYVDNVQTKIRYITLCAFKYVNGSLREGFYEDQISWFQNTALNVPDGYDVIVFSHFFKKRTWALHGANDIDSIIGSFNSDTSNHGKVLCLLEGHTHWDSLFLLNCNVPITVTTSDTYLLQLDDRVDLRRPNTQSEQAFDVVAINRDAKTITLVRIGAKAECNVNVEPTDEVFTQSQTLEERIVHYEAETVATTKTLTATITPVSWHTSNDGICTVNNGVVTAVGTGSAYVYALGNSGELEAWIIVVN